MSDQDTGRDDDTDDLDRAEAEMRAGDAALREREAADDDLAPEEGDEGADGDASRREREPLSAEEAERRWRASAQGLSAERRQRRALEARLSALQSGAGTPAEPPKSFREQFGEKPDKNEDPIGYMEWADAVIEANLTEREESAAREVAAATHRRQVETVSTLLAEAEEEFAGVHPDYNKAAEHYAKRRREELESEGTPREHVDGAFYGELLQVTARALQAGRDPADMIYRLAQGRGFGVDRAAARMDTVERGQRSGRSLSAGGGRQGAGGVDPRAVANASDEQFQGLYARLAATERKRGRR